MPLLACACAFLTFRLKRLPLLVAAEGTCLETARGTFAWSAWRRRVRKFILPWLDKTKMCDRLNSIIAFGLISFAALSLSSRVGKRPPSASATPGSENNPAFLPGARGAASAPRLRVRSPPAPRRLPTREHGQVEKEGDGSSGY